MAGQECPTYQGPDKASSPHDELPPADAPGRAAPGGLADHHPPDQPAPVPDGAVGGDDVPTGGEPDVARVREDPPVADPGLPDAGDRDPDVRGGPAAVGGLARGGRP